MLSCSWNRKLKKRREIMKEKVNTETVSFFCGEVKVRPIRNVVQILKEHHVKYCECFYRGKLQEIWTGDGRPTCKAKFRLLKEGEKKKNFRCSKSKMLLIVLESSKEEKKALDEMRLPHVPIITF
jgi:hypothetical protein